MSPLERQAPLDERDQLVDAGLHRLFRGAQLELGGEREFGDSLEIGDSLLNSRWS